MGSYFGMGAEIKAEGEGFVLSEKAVAFAEVH